MTRAILLSLLFASAAFGQSVTLTWNQASMVGVTGFLIQRSSPSQVGPYTTIQGIIAPTACPCTYNDVSGVGNVLTPGQPYFYQIVTTGPGGNAAPSNQNGVTIPAPPPPNPPVPPSPASGLTTAVIP